MKIFYQTNENNCGIAITKTLIYHFYKKEICDEELYDNTNINEHGISIENLEKLNKKFGIILKSYRIEFEEFIEHKVNDFFILLINKKGGQHYTIGKKNTKGITLYDPAEGKISLGYEQLKDKFTGIYIEISKENNKYLSDWKRVIKELDINWKDLTNLFIINVIVLIFSIISDLSIRFIFSQIGSIFNPSDILKTSFTALIVYSILHSGEIMEIISISETKNKYSKSFSKKLSLSFVKKQNNYFKKLGSNQFLLITEHIDNLSTFISEYLNSWLIGVGSLISIIGLMIYFNPIFIITLPISFINQYISWYFHKKSYEENFPKINIHNQKSKKAIINLIEFFKKEINRDKLQHISKEFNKEFEYAADYVKNFSKKNQIISKINEIINNLIYLTIIFISAYFTHNKSIRYEDAILLSILYRKSTNSFSSLISFYAFKYRYQYSKSMYKHLLNIGNIKEKISLNPPKTINIVNLIYSVPGKTIFNNLNIQILPNTMIYGASGSGKSLLYQLISQKIGHEGNSIYFDDKEIRELADGMNDLIIYQPNESYIGSFDLSEILEKLTDNEKLMIIELFKLMNLNPYENINIDGLSSGQKQFINLLNLLKFKNKLIILDEVTSNINLENKLIIFRTLIPKIAKNNFLICSEHCKELTKFFPRVINIEKQLCLD